MAKKNRIKVDKDIDKKNKNNILKKNKGRNVLINIIYILIAIFVYFLKKILSYCNVKFKMHKIFKLIF